MADWEKVVTAYDTVDKAKVALNVLKTSGIDTSNVSLLDRSVLVAAGMFSRSAWVNSTAEASRAIRAFDPDSSCTRLPATK